MNKSIKAAVDWVVTSIIFLVSIIEFISWRFSFGEAANITDIGNGYLIWYHPLFSSLTIWLFALLLLLKIFIFSHCIYTNLVTIIYFLIQTINVSAFFFLFGAETYNTMIYPIFALSILTLSILKILRCLESQPQQ